MLAIILYLVVSYVNVTPLLKRIKFRKNSSYPDCGFQWVNTHYMECTPK